MRRQIAPGKRNRGRQAKSAGLFRRQHDIARIDPVLPAQNFAEARPPFGFLPSVEDFAQRSSGHRKHAGVERAEPAQMQHHFRHAAGQKDAHCRMTYRAIGQDIDEPRHFAINGNPVLDRRAVQAGGMRDGRNVQEQIGRAAECRVNSHRVAKSGFGENLFHR